MTTTTAPALTELTGTYTLDPAHSRIGFVARHAMVTKVRGAFNDFVGTATLDGADPANSRAQVTINAASIDTRNAQRDEHLRSNDFLAMADYPQITFSSTGVRQVDDTTFEVTGDLTIKGVTNPVTIPFSFEGAARTRSATCASGSRARSRSTARTTASPGTPRWRPAACWSARRSPWSSRSPRSGTPDPVWREHHPLRAHAAALGDHHVHRGHVRRAAGRPARRQGPRDRRLPDRRGGHGHASLRAPPAVADLRVERPDGDRVRAGLLGHVRADRRWRLPSPPRPVWPAA